MNLTKEQSKQISNAILEVLMDERFHKFYMSESKQSLTAYIEDSKSGVSKEDLLSDIERIFYRIFVELQKIKEKPVLQFEHEIISIAEMITDSVSHCLVWYDCILFKDKIEEIKSSIVGKEEIFLKELSDWMLTGDGWELDDIISIHATFTPTTKFNFVLQLPIVSKEEEI